MEKIHAAIEALGITGPQLEGMSKRSLGQLIMEVRSGEWPLGDGGEYPPDELVDAVCWYIGIICRGKDSWRR